MSAIHQPLPSEGGPLDWLENPESGLRIGVSRQGAELVSLQAKSPSGESTGFLYRDGITDPPASGWSNHATVMGYYIHRLWKEQSSYAGHIIRGGNHGFLRHIAYAAPEVSSEALTYRVSSDQIPEEAYPFKVSLSLTYRMAGAELRIEFDFQNEETSREVFLSFGLHPGFALGRVESARLELPGGTYLRHYAPGNFLNGETESIFHEGGVFSLPTDKLPDSFLFGLEKVENRRFKLIDTEAKTGVELDFSECPYMTIWSDLHPFLCVEPCWGLPDSNPPLPFDKKVGIQSIPPGGSLRKSFGIRPFFGAI
jgi:galactose mutarotase-like enzyme